MIRLGLITNRLMKGTNQSRTTVVDGILTRRKWRGAVPLLMMLAVLSAVPSGCIGLTSWVYYTGYELRGHTTRCKVGSTEPSASLAFEHHGKSGFRSADTTYRVEDDFCRFKWEICGDGSCVSLKLTNLSSVPIVIPASGRDAAFFDEGKNTHELRIAPPGSTPPGAIAPHDSVELDLFPVDYRSPGHYRYLFTNPDFGDTRKEAIDRADDSLGESVTFLLPVQVGECTYEYRFTFTKDEVWAKGGLYA